jgi:hypothetical protein
VRARLEIVGGERRHERERLQRCGGVAVHLPAVDHEREEPPAEDAAEIARERVGGGCQVCAIVIILVGAVIGWSS